MISRVVECCGALCRLAKFELLGDRDHCPPTCLHLPSAVPAIGAGIEMINGHGMAARTLQPADGSRRGYEACPRTIAITV